MTPHKVWPHAPIHRIGSDGVYMVTGATLYKKLLFSSAEKLTLLENEILALANLYHWQLEAWAVFMNHYHLIARGDPSSNELDKYLKHIHRQHRPRVKHSGPNQLEERFWYNFWETRLTYERSYFARLNYVHQNAIKHGLVKVANQYEWCSAAWFERTAPPSCGKNQSIASKLTSSMCTTTIERHFGVRQLVGALYDFLATKLTKAPTSRRTPRVPITA